MKRLLFILIIFLCTSNIDAQEKMWTLNDCVLYAIEHSSKVNNQKSTNSIYHQDYLEAIGNLLPSISANTSAGFNFGRGIDQQTNNYIDINSFNNAYGLSASLTLFDGLANYTKVKIGRANKLKGKHEMDETKDLVAYDTMEAFLNVLYNSDLVNIAEQQVKESEQNLQQVKRMEELGVKGYPDVVEIEAKYAEDNFNLTKQKNVLIIATIILKEKMNFPIEEELSVQREDSSDLIIKVQESPLAIYEKSQQYNPTVQAATSALRIKKLDYKASKGNLMPRISMGVGTSTNFFRYMDGSEYSSFKNQFKNNRGEYMSFSLSIPIFSGFSRSASVKRAKAQMHMAQTNRDDVLRKLYSDIEQAVADANGQVDEYNQAVKQKSAAQTAYNVNLKKYEEGLIDPIILHTSSNRLLKSKAEELNAMYKYLLKYRLVNYYKGEPFFVQN